MTRRANHWHIFIVALIPTPAPGTGRGLFVSGGLNRAGGDATFPFCRRIFAVPSRALGSREMAMKQLLVGALIVGSLLTFEARAQERAGDAALGALSGAVVLGPVGAVAGAFIGYAAGPSIARSWGIRRSASRSRARHAAQPGPAPQQQAVAAVNSPPPVRTSPLPARRTAPPPVQGFD